MFACCRCNEYTKNYMNEYAVIENHEPITT